MHTVALDGLHSYSTRWHDLWEIIGAIATVSAVAVALYFSHRDSKARKKAEEDLAAEHEKQDQHTVAETLARRRAQAELVIAWYGDKEYEFFREENQTDIPDWYARGVSLINHSRALVFDVAVHVVSDLTTTIYDLPVIPVFPSTQKSRNFELPKTYPTSERLRAYLTFRDVAGVWWKRYEDGELRELTEQEAQKLASNTPSVRR